HNVYAIALSEIDNIQAIVAIALARAPKSQILVIEDDPAIATLTSKALEKDFDVTVCNDGENGLAVWREHEFDLVLLDLMLPDISGERILEHITEHKPEQLVVIITAHGTIDRHQRLIEKGAFDFVYKPFDINRLRSLCLQMMSERACAEADRSATQIRHRLNRVGRRLHAASADLKRGRVAIAARHLDHACIEQPMDLTDDEWTELIAEFDK
ncbi:MAG: response regulator, partial [Oricola sp.]|nr:response regulator [Oricola sp.]